MLSKCLMVRAVVGFPDNFDVKKALKREKIRLILTKEFKHYLHKTLSKRIVVLEPAI